MLPWPGSIRVVLRSGGGVLTPTDYWPCGETLEQTAEATRWLSWPDTEDHEKT